jgi:ferrous iron transport protein B
MKVGLVGNPNTGKSSIFNLLTGLRQQVGNFPGITVERKVGSFQIDSKEFQVIDFPGTYSIYPRSKDEKVVYDVLSNPSHQEFPDVCIVVVDASNLERNLLLFSQVYDLQLPVIMALNMTDVARKNQKEVRIDALQKAFPSAQIVETNARAGMGRDRLIQAVSQTAKRKNNDYFLGPIPTDGINDPTIQEAETASRYEKIQGLINEIWVKRTENTEFKVSKWDRILVHPLWGYLIFAAILMVVFQFIFSFAAIPMDFIDGSFVALGTWMQEILPQGVFSDLLSQGIVPGIGGVLVFVPQIAFLFFFISLLEESGYLARVVFIMDRLMRPLGLNGKSVVPLLSSVACAIPGVMATRTISDWKERLITILVAPLMSCSARIPVYTILISLVIPDRYVFGILNLQGLVLFGLYSLGLVSALLVALVLKKIIQSKDKGFLLMELPQYQRPKWGNVGLTVWEKVRVFVWDAGKIILALSVILWALASYGPGDRMENAVKTVELEFKNKPNADEEEKARLVASVQLENSYMGILGKSIEPVIKPLGYDWKIGISLISSFAAREVFVGSLATIYAVHAEDNQKLLERLSKEKRSDGTLVYNLASGASLMVFYVYAMQCMATFAIVKRETKSWKWPLIQMAFMGVLAYLAAFITYQILS